MQHNHGLTSRIASGASVLCCAVLVLAGACLPAAAEEEVFQAGAAVSNVTPPLGLPIVGGWSPVPAVHVHDELNVRCLVLDDGKTRLAFALCDSVGLPMELCDRARAEIVKHTGIPAENILIAATHTHSSVNAKSAPHLGGHERWEPYQEFLVSRIADGVRRAVNNLEPARIGWGSASEPAEVFNRRWHMKPGTPMPNPFGGEDQVVMNPGRGSADLLKPAGPTDPEIAFLSVRAAHGRPLALLANYSLHYVGGTGPAEMSADYFAMFADKIQQKLGADRQDPPFVGIMSNGTSGDINNINFTKRSEKLEPYEKMSQVAEAVAQKVYEAEKNVSYNDWVKLDARRESLTLRVRKPTPEILAYFEKVRNRPEGEAPYNKHELTYADRIENLARSPETIDVWLQAFRIGDAAVCAIPFEVFVQIGLDLKAKSPMAHTFTISQANGSFGYLPTRAQHKLGGYETWMGTNNVEEDASLKITEILLGALAALHP